MALKLILSTFLYCFQSQGGKKKKKLISEVGGGKVEGQRGWEEVGFGAELPR